MKIEWKKLIICIAVPLGVGLLSALITKDGMQNFDLINKPQLSPPKILFPIVWTILYILMGIASYLVIIRKDNSKALIAYGVQLLLNFYWSILFFNMQAYLFAFIWLVALWVAIIVTMILFYRVTRVSGYLLIPYLLWVTFAGYLTFGIYLVN